MKKIITLCVLMALVCVKGWGQTISSTTYPFTATSSVALEDISVSPTTLVAASSDDGVSGLTSIGFDFFYVGNRYTQFDASANGELRLGTALATGSAEYTNSFTAAAEVPNIAPYWDDLATGVGGYVRYKLLNTGVNAAPNRKLVIEWKVTVPRATGGTAAATFQAWLSESTGKIEFVYGNGMVVNSGGASIGLGSSSSVFASVTLAATSTSSTCAYGTANNANTIAITSGTKFAFTPISVYAPTNLTFPSIGLTTETLSWTPPSPTTGVLKYDIYKSTDNVTFTYDGQVSVGTNTYTATGLTPSTTYYWKVYSQSEGALSSALPGSQISGSCSSGLSGIKTVGVGGDYANLTAAIAAINANGVASNLILELTSTYVSTSETFPITLGNSTCLNSGVSVTIRPATGTTPTITSSNTTATIDINAGKYWIIDGRAGGTGSTPALTITNTSTSTGGTAVRFINDAQNNTIQYTTLKGTYASITSGVVLFSTALTSAGNSNNTITYCNIDAGAGSLVSPTATALNGIYSIGGSTYYNSNNTVSNNNIYDFFGANGNNSAGIYLNTYNTGWTISGNRIYQTNPRISTSGLTTRAIYINSSGGGGYTITNNVIGYANSSGTGNTAYGSGAATRFIGMDLTLSTTASSIQGNTVSGITLITTSGATSTYGVFSGIYVQSGNVNIGTTTGNTIGAATGTGAISVNATTSGALINGITVASSGTVAIQNNIISSLTTNSSATIGYAFYGIYTSGTGAFTISSNTIGNSATTDAVSIGTTGSTSGTVTLYGMNLQNTGVQTVTGNNLYNITAYSTSTSTFLYGINSGSSTTLTGAATGSSFTSNTLSTLTTTSTATSGTFSVLGMNIYPGAASMSISLNTISALRNTNTTAASALGGMFLSGTSAGGTVSRNRIYDITSPGTSTPALLGLYINSGGWTVSNNMISITNGSNAVAATLYGIWTASSSAYTQAFYYNSVYIGSTGAGSAVSYGFLRSSNATVTVQDNIFANVRSGSTGNQYAIANTYTTPATGWTSDYNVLNSPNTAAVGLWNATVYSFANWQLNTSQDAHSASGITVTFTAPATGDLHLNLGATPTPIESGGVAVPGITIDYDGQTRVTGVGTTNGGGQAPDIGADEFDGAPQDLVPPAIAVASANACSGAATVVTATITDASGVPTALLSTGLPVLYYKVGTGGTYTAVQGVSIGSNQYTFTFISGATAGNTIYYYIAAQDNVGNVGVYPSAGASGLTANPPAASTPPTTPLTLAVTYNLSGTYTVGAGGNFTSLTAAVSAYNNACAISGPVVFSLTDASYSTGETFPISINASAFASSTNTLTIKPTLAGTTISGSSASGLIVLNGADYVTIDGSISNTANAVCPVSAASRDLTILNTNTGTSSAVVWLQTTSAADAATNDVVKNCILTGSSTSSTLATLIGVGSGSATISATSTGTGNINNSFINNAISKVQYGIFLQGASAANKNTGTVINQNIINGASPNNVQKAGIYIGYDNGAMISGNTITNISGTTGYAWGISGGLTGFSGSTTTGNDVTNATITKNNIGSIRAASTYGVAGIAVASVTSGTTLIANNMISDAFANGTLADIGAGIYIGGGTGSVTNVYYNSITMASTLASGSYSNFGIAVNGSNPTVDLRNNIVVNTGSNGYNGNRALGFNYSTFTNLTSNNNDLYVTGTSSAVVQTVTLSNTGFTSYTSVTGAGSWNTASGKDANSKNVLPNFVSATNLHLQVAGNALLSNTGAVVSVTDDIDCEARSATPDIGADEFVACTPPTATASSNTPVCSGGTLSLIGTTDIGTSFTWSGPNGFISTVQNPSIANVTTAAAGTYTFTAFAAGCTSTPATTVVVINATPSALTVTPASTTVCVNGIQSLTATGGTNTGTAAVGTSATVNATTSYPAPYTNYYGGAKHQMIIRASELTALGLTTGSKITSVAFNVTAVGSTFTGSLSNFQINMGLTTSAVETSTAFLSVPTVVYGPLTQAIPTTSLPQTVTHTLTTPFVWNGTDNIVIQTSYSNANSGATTDYVQMTETDPGFVSTNWYRADAVTSAAVLTAATPTSSGNARPNMILGVSAPAPITWSPITDLYSDATATTAYTGTAATTVYSKPTAAITYTATATNGTCISTGTAALTLSNLAVTETHTNVTCNGLTNGTITATGTGGTAPYTYSKDNITYSATTTFTGLAAGNYTIYVKDANSCTSTVAVIITQPTAVTISNASSANPTCNNGTNGSITVAGGGGTAPYTYAADGGTPQSSGTFSGLASGSHTFVVTDASGCTATASYSLTNPAPIPVSAGNNGPICEGSTLTLTATGGTSYAWAGPNGFTSSLQNPSINNVTTAASGIYTVTVTDANGCSNTATTTATVNATVPVSVTLAASQNPVCAGTLVTFTATPTNGGTTPGYQFYVGGALQTSTGNTFSYTPANGDVVSVTLTSNVNCASGTANDQVTMSVTASVPVSVSLAASQNPVCSGTSVTYTATGTGGGTTPTYEFFVNNTSVQSPGASNTYTYTPAGNDQVKVVFISNSTCATGNPATSNVITMTVNPVPAAPIITTSGSATFCSGGSVTLTSSYATGNTWSNGATTQSIVVTAPGNYSVVYNDGNCTSPASATTVVTVNPTPAVPTVTTSGSTSFCTGGSVTLTSSYATGNTWSNGATTQSIVVTAPGNYTVTYSNGTCSSTSAATTVTVNALPTVTASSNCSTTYGGNVTLTATATPGSGTITTYQWVLNGTTNVGTNSATYTTSTPGSYTGTVTNSNGCLTTSNAVVISAASGSLAAGTYTIGATGCNTFTTIASALTYINTNGIAGAVVFNVPAGYAETAPAASGFVLGSATLNATLSSSNTLKFVKSGTGANPVLTAAVGVALPSGTVPVTPDGIFSIRGADYVTLDGLTFTDNNSASATVAMEFGIGMFKTSVTDGTNNNTIQNCTFNMQRVNNAGGTLPLGDGAVAVGIYNSIATDATTSLTPTAVSGANSNNKIYSNTINGGNTGIDIYGYSNTVAPYNYTDQGNDIGGASASTGNAILNYGGGAITNPAVGIRSNGQYGLNVSYNTINNNNGSGVNHATTLRGIWLQTALNANETVSNNIITVSSGATTSQLAGIENTAGGIGTSNTVAITNNTIVATYATATTGYTYGIYNNGVASNNLNVNSNAITINTAATSGTATNSNYAIYQTGAVVSALNINGNTIAETFTATSTTSYVAGIYNTAAASTAAASISNNTFNGFTFSGSTGGTTNPVYVINQSGTPLNETINNNNFNNLSLKTTGAVYLINNSYTAPASTGASKTVQGNYITTALARTGATATSLLYCYYDNGSSTTATHTISGNTFSNITTNNTLGLGAFYGIYSTDYSGNPGLTVYNNTVSNVTANGLSVYGIYLGGFAGTSASPNLVYGNTVNNITSTGATTLYGMALTTALYVNAYNNTISAMSTAAAASFYGMYISSGTLANIYSNTISGLSTSGASSIYSVYFGGGTTVNFYKNKIYDISGSNAGSIIWGTYVSTSPTTLNYYNNLIGDLRNTAASSTSTAVAGFYSGATNTATENVSYNTINLNATSSGTNFSTAGIYHTYSATATSAQLVLRNNVIVNNSTPNGSGLAVAFRRSAATSLNNYSSASNNNDFYAGTPGTTRLLYYDGTNTDQTLATFKARVAPAESASVTENPTFLSTAGTSASFLHVDPSVPTQLESGGTPVAGITDDYDGDIRYGNTGYAGTGTATDIGSDEFNGISSAPVITNVTVPTGTCTPTAHTINADVTTTIGTISSVVLNYNNGTTGSVTMTLVSGNTYTGTIPAGTAGATVTWSITATNSGGVARTYTGNSYTDAPLTGITATASASPTAVCAGSTTVLTGVFNKAGTATLGSGTTTASSYDGIFYHLYGGLKSQFLVKASELSALGLTTGNITSLGIVMSTVTSQAYSGFAVNIAPVTLTSMSSGLYSGSFTQVYSATSYTPVNGTNTFTFSTPFTWDGTSNIVIQFCWSNNNPGGTSNYAKVDAQSFVSCAYYRADSQTPATLCGTTTATSTTSNRPQFIFAGNVSPVFSSYSWSNGTTTVGTTNPLTVTPSATTTYTLTATNASGCTITSSGVTVTVNPLPVAPTTANSIQCGTGIPTASATGGTNGQYRWYTVATGGTALPGETNSTLASYSISATTTFYVAINNGTCESTRTPVTATVTTPDPVTASASPTAICLGASDTLRITQTGTTNTYTYTWTSTSGSGISGSVTGSQVIVTPTAAGTYTYTVTAFDGNTNCTTTSVANVTVNALPVITSATATPSTICAGSSSVLTAKSVNASSGSATIGSGTTSGSSSGISPYSGLFEGAKSQYLITASELTSAGFVAGNLTSLTFTITSAPTLALSNYRIALKATTLTALTSSFQSTTSFTTVYGPQSYLPTVGANTHTFTAPFAWDGTSNIIVDVSFDNDPGNTCTGGSGVCYSSTASYTYTTTASNSVTYTYADNTTGTRSMYNQTGSNLGTPAVTTTRPNIKFAGQVGTDQTSSYTWVWNPGNLTGSTVTVTPTVTTPYTVTATNAVTGCSSAPSTVTVTVNPLPTEPTATNSTQCGPGVPTAAVADPNGYTTPTFTWYSAATGGTVLQSGTSATYTTSVNTTTTFYVSVKNPATGCESARTQVTVTVNTPDAITASATPSSICIGASDTLRVTQTGTTNTYVYTWTCTSSNASTSGISGSSTGSQVIVTPTAAGTYTYQVSGYDMATTCTAVSTVTLTVSALPTTPTITASATKVCAGTAVMLTANTGSNTYCTPTFTSASASGDYISNVTFAGINNTTGDAANDYTYYSSLTANVTAGTAYSLSLAAGTSFNQYFGVWIDYNQNGTFEASEFVYTSTSASSLATTSITIPATAYTGVTRMRVISRFSAVTYDQSCSIPSSFGEAEDYNVNIAGGTTNPNAVTYLWSTGATTQSITVNPTATTAYTVIVTNGSNCSATSAPTTVTVASPLSGIYSVGNGTIAGQAGHYATLTAAVADYNTLCTGGAVTFVLTDATYSTGETFPIVINANSSASATNTLTIKPASGVTATISGNSATTLFKLNGADYVIIDGSNSGTATRNLTITNTNTAATAAVIWLNSVSSANGAINNTVKNTIITGTTSTSLDCGIISSGSIYGAVAEAQNSGNTYQNNIINTMYTAIAVVGPSGNESGTVITGNIIGSSAAANKMGISGIELYQQASGIVTNNSIAGVSAPALTASGISIYGTASGITISGNKISDVKSTYTTTGYRSSGIDIEATTTSSNVNIYNNFISDVTAYGGGIENNNGSGIFIYSGGGYNIYYNSISLATNQTNTSSRSACIVVSSNYPATAGTLNIVDNILSNTETVGNRYVIYVNNATNAMFGTINYNDYYVPGGNIGYLSANKATLAAWQAATAQDAISVNINPLFTDATTDLHINVGNGALDNLGTPVAGITTDIDAETRSTTTPDIGADEFSATACNGTSGGTVIYAGSNICTSGSATLTASGYPIGTSVTYQWEYSSDNFASDINDLAGQTSVPTATTGTITTTTFYRLRSTCTATSTIWYSVSDTVTVITPLITGATGTARCGPGTVTLTATGTTGTTVYWYDAATGGTLVGTGSPFTTPRLNSTTTYYAGANTGGIATLGKASSPGTDGAFSGTNSGLVFNALSGFTLNSVVIYPIGSGSQNVIIELRDASNNTLNSTTVTVTGGSGTPTTVPLGFYVPTGTGYRLVLASVGGLTGLWRDFTGGTYPYTATGVASITGGLSSGSASTTYYYFYNWSISTGCESARTAVTATVNTAPAITIAPTSATICSGSSITLTASSTSNPSGYTYTWTPGNLMGASQTVSPTSTTIYTVTATDNTSSTYAGCTTTESATVTVNPVPSAVTVTPDYATICADGIQQLTATGGSTTGTVTKLAENFATNAPSWSKVNNSTGGISPSAAAWTQHPDGYTYLGTFHSNDNSEFYMSNSDAQDYDDNFSQYTSTILTSPSFSTVGLTTLNLSFYQYYHYYSSDVAAAVEISTNGSTWTTLKNYKTDGVSVGTYAAFAQSGINLNSYVGNATVYIRFRYESSYGFNWALDNVVVSGQQNVAGQYTWTPIAGLYTNSAATTAYTSGSYASTVYAKPTATILYTASSANSLGCSSTDTVTVKVSPAPTAAFGSPTYEVCYGTAANINVTGTAGAVVHYHIGSSSTDYTDTLNASGSGTITTSSSAGSSTSNTTITFTLVSATNLTSGCSQSLSGSTTLTIYALPAVADITGPDYIAFGKTGSYSSTTTGGTWSIAPNGTGSTLGSSSANPTTVTAGTTAGAFILSYTVTGAGGCATTVTKTIQTFDNAITRYRTKQDGYATDPDIWSILNDNNVWVDANAYPGNSDNIEVRHNLSLLFADYDGTSNGIFKITDYDTVIGGVPTNVRGTVTIAATHFFQSQGSVDFNGRRVTLKSGTAGTAAIGVMTTPILNATNVQVERFTDGKPSANSTGSRRAWRLITSPVTGQSIHQSWQEDAASNVVPNAYGTLITGAGFVNAGDAAMQGYDYTGKNPGASIKRYDLATNTWVSLPGTGGTPGTLASLQSQPAFMLFVRGDRNIGSNTSTSSVATLRSTGELQQSNQPLTFTAGNKFILAGNPYASTINFEQFIAHNSTLIQDKFYSWNSTIGTYGAYILVTHTGTGANNGGYEATPDEMTGLPEQNKDKYKYIPNGSGFFVVPLTSSTSGTLGFQETDKAPGLVPPVNPFKVVSTPANVRQLLVNLNLKDSAATLADGFRAKFSPDYEGNEEDNSTAKIYNFNENLNLVNGGKAHIIEARGEVKKTDTLFMKMWYVIKRSYQLQMKGDNFATAPGIRAWLVDGYLGTKQELALGGSITTLNFEVNSDSASAKSDRFMIVFENNASVLPVTITKVKAAPSNGGVQVSWTAANEVNIKGYTIEKSGDGGRSFTDMGTQQPAHNNAQAAVTSYSGYDAQPKTGDNFYRIRIEGKDGSLSYSEVVKVTIGATGAGIQITLYPNPVREGKANLSLSNLKEGTYLVSVYTGSGQTVYQRKIYITLGGTTQTEPLILGSNIAQGSYQIKVSDNKGNILFNDQLIVGR